MGDGYKRREEKKDLIRQFEDQLKSKAFGFYDIEVYEEIIDYYLDNGNFKKALKACNIAIDQYPYSTELILEKAQVLSNLEEYEQALELLHKASQLQPGDAEASM